MRSSWILAATLLAACGGPAEGPKNPSDGSAAGSGSAVKPNAGGDDVVDVPATPIKGLLLEPEAMDGLGVPAVPLCKKCTVATEKAKLASAKNLVEKQAHAVILASELFRQSQQATGDAKKQLLTEARQILRDVVASAGAKPDETVLLLLGRYELLLDDTASAEKVWAQLLTVAPSDKEAPNNRAWWALSLLKQGKNAEALAVVKDQALDKSPELAYVTAWARWRTGDNAGAWKALVVAANAWDGPPGKGEGLPGRDVIKRDLLVFAARTGASMADGLAGAGPYYGKQPADQYELLRGLAQSYHFSARWADALAADNKALELKVPPNDKVAILFEQAQLTLPLDSPAEAAKYATAAVNALPACGDKCSAQDQQNVIAATFNIAARFHSIFATANDDRYYPPAHDLYALVVVKIIDPKLREQAADYQNKLELTFKNHKAGTGRHDKGDTAAIIDFHSQEVQACYEAGLQMNGKLLGDVTLMIELDQSGAVKGVATEPKAGAADLPAVAQCVADHAKGWKLPARGSKGTTRVKIPYNLSQRK